MGETWGDLERHRQGDRDALGRLYSRYYSRVLSFVRIRMGSALRARIEPEDIVQRTFVVALKELDRFELREPGALVHWLATIAEKQIRDALKYWTAEKRAGALEVHPGGRRDAGSTTSTGWSLADSTLIPPDRAANAELQLLLEECIHGLPDDYRQVILLRDIAGASLAYTAQEMQRPSPQAVAMLHARAKLSLMRTMRGRVQSSD